jgi:zeta-carotene isomerase
MTLIVSRRVSSFAALLLAVVTPSLYAFAPTTSVRRPLSVGVSVSVSARSSRESTFLNSASPQKEDGRLPEVPFLTKTLPSDRSNDLMIGEDAGTFDINKEEWGKFGEGGWFTFSAAVGTIMTAVAVLWVYPPTGYADDFLASLENIAGGNPHIVTLLFGIIFPLVHSGLASLRPYGEKIVGSRMWRVIFAFPSLCLSYSWIAYFIAHAHDGIQFYDLSSVGWAHALAWTVNFASFFFLYPSVFNLKEVAAVEKPKLHLWETGMIRITRHPQFIGQAMWSAGHLAMVGTSFTAETMALLVGHHAFSCWNGDRRYYAKHGDDFLKLKERTSIAPFQAILEGRQVLPKDYYKELLRAPYALIAVGTLGAYFAHPYMQGGAALVRNTGLVPGGILDGILP